MALVGCTLAVLKRVLKEGEQHLVMSVPSLLLSSQ